VKTGIKRPIKLTTGGWIFILYTIGVGAGAINTGNNLLYLIFGVFLGLIMASGVLSDTDLWRIRGNLRLPETAEAKQNCHLSLTLTNLKKWFPAISVTAEVWGRLRDESLKLRVFFPFIGAGQEASRELIFVPPGRGYFEVEKIYVYTRFPFGLLWKRWTIAETVIPAKAGIQDSRNLSSIFTTWIPAFAGMTNWGAGPSAGMTGVGEGFFVYPALLPGFQVHFAAFSSRHEQDAPVEIWGDGTTAAGIRDYKPGDNPKKIHWKATAKRAGLETWDEQSWFLKEMERDGIKEVFLSWPGWEGIQKLNESDFENFIRFTASMVWKFKTGGHRVWLLIFPEYGKAAYSVTSVMEFLAIFEIGTPKEILSRFLEPIHEFRRDDLKGRAIDLLERFHSWKGEVTSRA